MHKILVVLGLALGLGTPLMAGNFGSDPDAVILTFNMSGGQKPRTDGPILQIRADGTVRARALMPRDPSIEARLSEEEMARLFQDLAERHQALSFSHSNLEAEIDRSSANPRHIADAPTTDLQISLPDGDVSVRVYAVSYLARQTPDSSALQDLHAIQVKLLGIAEAVARTQ